MVPNNVEYKNWTQLLKFTDFSFLLRVASLCPWTPFYEGVLNYPDKNKHLFCACWSPIEWVLVRFWCRWNVTGSMHYIEVILRDPLGWITFDTKTLLQVYLTFIIMASPEVLQSMIHPTYFTSLCCLISISFLFIFLCIIQPPLGTKYNGFCFYILVYHSTSTWYQI